MTVSWKLGGVLLGVVFSLALMLVKPIGVSTQFVVVDGIIWNALDASLITETAEGKLASPQPYIEKEAKYIVKPLNYNLIFVLAMMAGAAISVALRGGLAAAERRVPALWAETFTGGTAMRMLAGFVGGMVVLFGARLADGCTSGHMMSGMSQTAVSGFIFALGAFATAVPLAILMYGRR